MIKKLLLLSLSVFIFSIAFGQQPVKIQEYKKQSTISNIKWNTGSEVIRCSDFKITIPVRDMPQVTPLSLPDDYLFTQQPDKRDMPVQTFEYTVEEDGPKYGNDAAIVQKDYGKKASKSPLQNWDGYVNAGGRPNDPTGAAGPNYYIQSTNGDKYIIYDKNGTHQHTGNISDLVGGDGDPIVLYDKDAQRWFIGQFGGRGDNGLYIAISATSDPLGSWYGYTFSSPDFPDYEKFSAWHDGYYMTANYSQKIFAFNRTKMLAGDATAEAVYQTFAPPQSGFFVPMPADASDGTMPTSGPCPIFCYQDNAWSGVTNDAINVYNASVNWDTETMTVTQAASINTSSFDASYDSGWDDVSQPGTTDKLDGIGGAMGFRAQFKPWSGYNTVVLTWAVQVTSSQRGIFWCELRQDQSTENWSLYQEGIYAPGTDNVWLGSIAMNDAGDIALAYSKTNPSNNTYMSLAYTGRMSCDPLGTLPISEVIAQAGAGYQYGINRVGDYAHTALDPDGVTFWHTGEYMYKNGQWDAAKTRIFSFQLPGSCAAPVISNITPTSLYKDRGKEITITGTDLNGCSFDLGGIAGAAISNDGTTAVVNFPAGNYSNGTLTVTNSSGFDVGSVTVNTRTTIPVDASVADNSDTHQTIDAAVDGLYSWIGSSAFTTSFIIEVSDGTYAESVTLNSDLTPTSTNTLTIQNASGASPEVDATGNDYGFNLGTVEYVTLEGFTVHSMNLGGIYGQGNYLTIAYNQVYNSTGGTGIKLETGTSSNISNNLCYNNYKYGIQLNSGSHIVKNNTLHGNGGQYEAQTGVELFNYDVESGDYTGWSTTGTSPDVWQVYDDATYANSPTKSFMATDANITLTYSSVDITGYENLTISAYARSDGRLESTDALSGEYSFDNSNWSSFFSINDDHATYTQYSLSGISPTSNTLHIRFVANIGRSEYWHVDDIAVSGDETISSFKDGAGIYVQSGSGNIIENNIIVSKSGDDSYYAVKTESGATINSDYNLYYANGNTNLFEYNGSVGNTGPLSSNDLVGDPQFVNAGTDFHIQSQNGVYVGGSWPPTSETGGTWTNSGANSIALDAGNPSDSYTNEPSGGAAINMGAYGNTAQASKSESTYVWEGDDVSSPTDWSTSENWSGGSIPGSANDITIPASCPNYPTINSSASCRNLTIENGGTLTFTAGSLSLAGNWTNNGTFNSGTGTVVFNGNTDQTIAGTEANSFNNININNGNNLILSANINISGTLTLTNGSLNIVDKNIDLGTSGSLSDESNTNMIFGTSGTITASNRVSELGGNIAGLGIEIASAVITDIDIIRGVQAQPGESGSASLRKYFDISATPGSGLNAAMTVHYFDHEFDVSNGGSDEKTFVFYRSTDGGATWTEKYEASVDIAQNQIFLDEIDAFSRWTVSSKTEQVLPVEWNQYSATCKENFIQISWSTFSEKNNDYFTIEKMNEIGNYFEIGKIDGSGNSNTVNRYSFNDPNINNGISYYRIKQTDYDGKESYSPIFSSNCVLNMQEPDINIFPNPFKDRIKIYVMRGYLGNLNIEIFDSRGAKIKENIFEISGSSMGLIINTSELDKGIYLVRVSGDGYSKTTRLVKQ
jgi:hypothetical protein